MDCSLLQKGWLYAGLSMLACYGSGEGAKFATQFANDESRPLADRVWIRNRPWGQMCLDVSWSSTRGDVKGVGKQA